MVSRRQVLGGGLVLSALALVGCAGGSRSSSSALPSPRWGNGDAAPLPAPYIPPVAQAPTAPTPPAPIAGLSITPRSAWTRTGIARPNDIYPMNGIRRITVHHDGLPPASLRTSAEIASRIEMIRRSHVEARGWADIGYHYVVDPTGRVWEGRNEARQGAHVKDQNENNLGILVLGNFERQSPTRAACASIDKIVAAKMSQHRVQLGAVRTHREMAPTECPGQSLQAYMNSTRNRGGGLAMLAGRSGLA